MTREEYIEKMARCTDGMTALSTGICPGCSECMSDYDYDDPEKFEDDISSGALPNEPHFSWSSCEVCGCTLGGDREVGHYCDENDEIVHLDGVCVDCMMYLANGDLPHYVEGE